MRTGPARGGKTAKSAEAEREAGEVDEG